MDLLANELGKWDGSDYIQEEALLACSHLTDEVKLALFNKSKSHQTRVDICEQSTLSVELQGLLIESLWEAKLAQSYVQFTKLIANPALDPTYHKKIASHNSDDIINALLSLENLSHEAQMVVLRDENHFLKLAKNPNISEHVQLSLLLQAIPEADAVSVLDALKPGSTSVFFYNIIYSHPFQESHFEDVYVELSQNPNLSADAVRVLVAFERKDENSSIMLNLASNPSLPKHWQLEFANSNNNWLKTRLASNPNLQDAARARLQEQGIESTDSSSDTSGATLGAGVFESMARAAVSGSVGNIFGGATKFQGGLFPSWFNGDKS